MHPVWFPPVSNELSSNNEIRRDPPATTLNYEPIQTDGFAQWIGQNLSDFEQVYGSSEAVYSSGFSFIIHQYMLDETDYLEVNTENNKITSIKIMGKQNQWIQPFQFGMTMNELAKLTMIYPNFSFSYEGKTVGFELMEDDMNYRPLIAFDNGSFAILFFNQKSNESSLDSIVYLDKGTMLKLNPYLITEGVSPHFVAEDSADWEIINQEKQLHSKQLFQLFRERDQLPNFQLNHEVQMTSEQVLGSFFANPEEHLTTERVQKLHRVQDNIDSDIFSLTKSETDDLSNAFSLDKSRMYIELPVYDPMFSMLSWYSIPYSHSRYMDSEVESLGIAFSKESVVVLLQKIENNTEDSDSIDLR